VVGAILTAIGTGAAVTVIVAIAVFVVSATDLAVKVILAEVATLGGAV
jgi:hypothetical protein